MIATIDPATLVFTGQLPMILVAAAALALPVSLALLRLYKRAVLRSMRLSSTASATADAPSPAPDRQVLRAGLEITVSNIGSGGAPGQPAQALYAHLLRRPLRAAAAYALGGFAFALVMAGAFLTAGGVEFMPVRFLLLFWTYAWPVVFTTTLALGSVRRTILLYASGYFLVFGVLGAVGIARSPNLDWTQVVVFWLLNNAPPTVLLLAFLNRRVRAVGPLVLLFMVLAVTGATLVVSLTGSQKSLMHGAVEVGSALGLGATGIFVGLHLLGFVLMGVVGWLALLWMRRRYERKQVSDESITFDAIWLLFGVVQSIELVFEGAPWILTGVVAVAAYKLVSTVAQSILAVRHGHPGENVRLLLLRVFALGKRSERMFDVLGAYWRHIGSIQLIAGPDLATKTVEPHEFLDFLSGRLARRFIDGPKTLERRLSEMDIRVDRDGRFRVNDFFCHDDTWRTVFSRLATQSDTVLMDLRSFSPTNAGVTFEVEELMNVVPLEQAVFVVDDTTSEEFLRQVLEQSWNHLRPNSPNVGRPQGRVQLLRFKGGRSELQQLLSALCRAAKAPATHFDVGIPVGGTS